MIIPPATQAGINDKAATEAALSILLAIGEYYQNQVAICVCVCMCICMYVVSSMYVLYLNVIKMTLKWKVKCSRFLNTVLTHLDYLK